MSKKIIGLFAQLAGGKDTVANYLVKKLNHEDGDGPFLHDFGLGPEKWRRVGFADAVKRVFMDSFNVTWEFIEEWKRKDEVPPGFDLNVRKGLQHIGDGFRKIQNDVWIRKALSGDKMAISDGRYINEAKMIKEQGGVCILLWRPGFENDDPNPSESQIKPFIDFFSKNFKDGPLFRDMTVSGDARYFDYFLVNDGTLDDLYAKIDNKVIPFLQEMGME